jgi:pilus assembly protein Flp/PilA
LDAIRTAFRKLRTDQRGATAIEYGLIAALIAIALITGASRLGGQSQSGWAALSNTLSNKM